MVVVVAKFRHNGLRYDQYGWKGEKGELLPPVATLEFVPVTEGSEENRMFWRYTPGGKLELQSVNRDVVKDLDLGKDYYLYISDGKMVPVIDPSRASNIIVNGRPMSWVRPTISYTELVNLVKPGSAELFTVSFAKGPAIRQTGTLTPGESADVADGMVFEADVTGERMT